MDKMPFEPGPTSTPSPPSGEQIEMHTLPREQSGFDVTVPGFGDFSDDFVHRAGIESESYIPELTFPK